MTFLAWGRHRRFPLRFAVTAMVASIAFVGCNSSATTVPSTPTTSPTAAPTGGQSAAPSPTEAPMQDVTINLGRFPRGAGAAFVTQYMINEHLVEDAGKTLGLNLTVNWSNMANAVAVGQALAGGSLDIGPMGSSAYVGLAGQNQPITPIAIAEGHFQVLLAVHKDSPIHTLADLKGKTVGTIVGTDLYNVLASFLKAEFGTADPTQAGVGIANIASVPQLATVPSGTDATIVTIPSFLQAQALGLDVVKVVDSFGMSGDAYDGAEGKGPGLTIESAKTSPFWPDGFYGHRAIFAARDGFVSDHPTAVQAFLMAQQQALQALQQMDPMDVAALVQNDWGIVPSRGAEIVAGDLLFTRGWSYLTEGDAAVLLLQGQLAAEAGATTAAISWDALKAAMEKGAAVAKAAYDATGQLPSAQDFRDTSMDLRGAPTWESSSWQAH